jgi:urease accessory protein
MSGSFGFKRTRFEAVVARMLQMISCPVMQPDVALPEVAVRVGRLKLAKRLWRGTAEDGTEFGCQLEKPLRHDEVIWQSAAARYVIRQEEEAVLEISLQMAASAAAGIGWAVGNLHLELMSEPGRLLTPDDNAARQLLERIQIPFRETRAVFRPGRFARGDVAAAAKVENAVELGLSHKH